MKRGLILILAFVVVVVAWWQVVANPAGEAIRTSIAEYSFSADSQEAVITMRVKGGMAMDNDVRYTLFGDGRLHRDAKSREQPTTVQLSFVEMDDLVRIAVEGELIGLDWKTLEGEILAKYPGVTTMTDTPRLTLDFSLIAAQDAVGNDLGPVSSTFSCVCTPALLEHDHEDVPEVRALNALTKALYAPFYPRKSEP